MNPHRLLAVALVGCLLSPLALRAEEASGYTMSLFDGRTLAGWHAIGCIAEVQDGAILIKSGNGVLHSDHRYSDFVLELDWKALKPDAWDSGVYFRCELPTGKRPWPQRYQVNLMKGMEGNVDDLTGASSKGLTRPGEWNHFKLTAIGTTAALEINGRPAWKADGLKDPTGYIVLQAEVPGGGQFLFRNIKITEVGFKSLFNGKDLSGWEPAEDKANTCWSVADGLLTCSGKPGPWLRSVDTYGDFNLRFQYRLLPGGNSGAYIRTAKSGNPQGKQSGLEIQVLDDRHSRYPDLKPYQFAGSIYSIAPAAKHTSLPAGNWNAMEIDCRGDHYRVTLNGTLVVDATSAQYPALKEHLLKGFLGLQNHDEPVYFRDLRIGPPQP